MSTPLPSRNYAWYTVLLLTVVYIFSYIDRTILGLLVEPIRKDLDLTDTQISLLLGPAFALFYTTLSVPLGWLADRWKRNWIVAIGVVVWSVATAACGLARNFAQMAAARVMVGVGEATLSPCALPMIADSFPPDKRGKPIAVYSTALSLGGGIAALAGASVIVWSKSAGSVTLPLLGQLAPWQFAFVAVGLPGIMLAVLMFLLHEPARQGQVGLTADDDAGLGDALRYLRRDWKMFGGFVAMVCVMTIIAYSQGWFAAMFERTWGWPAEKYALYQGIMMLAVGPASVFATGWYIDRLHGQGVIDAPIRLMIAATLIMLPTHALAPLMPNGNLAFALLALNLAMIASLTTSGATALMNITAGEVRSQVTALYYVIISVTGLMLGPTTVGVLSDSVVGTDNIRYAVSLVAVIYGLPLLFTLRGTLRRYRERVVRLA
ncbi:MAG: MFS transporter [Gammaproteobacteria bacterium]|nr:MFS transporter [Gammaproteobacteria bacterium]